MSREWSGVLAHADQRGRDAFAFEPITSPYLEVADGFVVRTPYSRTVIAELRSVPWARWDPASKAWRVPFRSFEELRRRWPAIEDAARQAEPEERRKREEGRKAPLSTGTGEPRPPSVAEAVSRAGGCTAATRPRADDPCGMRGVRGGHRRACRARGRRPLLPRCRRRTRRADLGGLAQASHAELVRLGPHGHAPGPADLARGWWQPTIEVLREERRRAASLERARATRRSKARE
jgi:hypothetical protein